MTVFTQYGKRNSKWHLHFELQKDGVYLNPIYYVETA